MTNPPSPAAVKVLLAAERARIESGIRKRISDWESFYEDYPEVEGTLQTIAELDEIIRSVVYASKTKAGHRRG